MPLFAYRQYDTIWVWIPFISGSLQNFISDSNVKSKPYSSNKSIDKLEKKTISTTLQYTIEKKI